MGIKRPKILRRFQKYKLTLMKKMYLKKVIPKKHAQWDLTVIVLIKHLFMNSFI
jgi:hypothetical protein